VYGQQEVVKDLITQRLADGGEIWFEAEATTIEGTDDDHPRITYRRDGEEAALPCEFVAGCDGSHGVARAALTNTSTTTYERSYLFAWLGVLAKTPPASDELIYAYHERGFASICRWTPTTRWTPGHQRESGTSFAFAWPSQHCNPARSSTRASRQCAAW
jgi:p-hydroxybenzoate 3-monooxygenase